VVAVVHLGEMAQLTVAEGPVRAEEAAIDRLAAAAFQEVLQQRFALGSIGLMSS